MKLNTVTGEKGPRAKGQGRNTTSMRDGYVFLLSVLVVGVIASAVAVSLVLLGLAASRSAQTLQQSAQALAYAQSCAERGLLKLRNDVGYAGGETVDEGSGNFCEILLTGGAGNEDRTLCVEGQDGDAVRRLQIVIASLLPETKILSWQEVDIFSFCSYP